MSAEAASHPEPIAVIGLGVRVAGDVATPARFWSFLLEGGSNVSEVPEERWEPYLRRDPRNAAVLRDTTRWGTFLDDLPGFDAEFFGVSPREAELMDPQQRLALEVGWEALEHAGIAPGLLAGSDTAVLMGVNSDDYGKLLMEDLAGIEAWTGIGTSLCGIANRVSHLLDLRGPSVALDAACASSLVAVHQACQLLRAGETSLALAGGVSALIGPGLVRVLDEAGATAPDGRCKTFDAAADGYGRGEGAGVVVLKRLADAQRDGDRVLAVVRGGAVAQDGRTVGIMSPNGAAQADMFRLACRTSGIDPATVDFVEAHGTGTPTGDPAEIGAISAVYGQDRTEPCRVGSVKPNVGHLEGGAGVLGLIKTVLALHHEAIPPTTGVRRLTPAVDWAVSGLRVPTAVESWPRSVEPRRAAVCSYGYGGTIAHVLVEEAPAGPPSRSAHSSNTDASTTAASTAHVVPLSARSRARLSGQAAVLASHLGSTTAPVAQIAATSWRRRDHGQYRAAIVADHTRDVVAGLDALARGEAAGNLVTGSVLSPDGRDVVWVFSGHGSHWAGMGRELIAAEPAFADVVDQVDEVFAAELGFSARDALVSGDLGGTDRVQALTFAMQVGLAAVLRSRGVTPAAVIGHSVGEVAACVVSGVFDLRQGAAVACHRARGFRSVAGGGAMALVRLSFADAQQRLRGRTDVVAAISASPESTVVSGDVDAVAAVCRDWTDQGVMVRRVDTDVAFHSPAMDALTDDLARNVAALDPPRAPTVPLYTTALPDPRSTSARDAGYWVQNLRGRVRFAEAVTAAAQDGHRVFLEVSAHPVVSHSVAETLLALGIDDHAAGPVLRRNTPEVRAVATAVAWLYCHGAAVDHGVGATDPWADDLPGTQWQHRRFWRTPTPPPGGTRMHDTAGHTLLGGRTDVVGSATAAMWQTRLDHDTRPYPGDHPVQGTEIVPAAVLLTTFLAAATAPGAAGAALAQVRLRTPVAPARARDLQVVLQDRELTLSTRLLDDDRDGGWLTHCSAVVADRDDIGEFVSATVALAVDLDAARRRCADVLPPRHVIDVLATLGVAAMGFDWEIGDMRRGAGELLAVVAARRDGAVPPSWAPLIDAATSAASTIFDGPPRLRMPARIERVDVHGPPPATATVLVRRRPGASCTDVWITDDAGSTLMAISGMAFEELENRSGTVLHRVTWHELPWDAADPPSGVVLVGGDVDGLDAAVRDLVAAGLPYRAVEDAAELESQIDSLAVEFDGGVLLVLPRRDEPPEASVDLVAGSLAVLVASSLNARLWVLTTGVLEGALDHAPLWGLSRIAAAEHPRQWGGVLDVASQIGRPGSSARLPFGALAELHGHGVVAVRDGVARVARLGETAPRTATAIAAPFGCAPGGTYLITGGTGALGLRVAHHLADLGARRVVLMSRSGLPDRCAWSAEGSERVREVLALEERGVSVTVAAVDLGAPGSADDLRAVLRDLPPVRGVVHAAGVEAGGLLSATTAEDFAAAMRPKVHGTMVLHEVFPPEVLDWMVLFSSCGYLAGFPGQSAYACANSFLDVMARHRRGLGDRTTAIAWTAWRGLGMGSTSEFVAAQLDAFGMGTVAPDDALRAFDAAMRLDDANVVVVPLTAAAAALPMFADVAPVQAGEDTAQGPGPAGAVEWEDPDWLGRQVLAAVAGQLGLPEAEVDPDLPLVELGVDSIMTVRLRRHLERQTGLSLSPTLLWEHPTAAAVTAMLSEQFTSLREP